MSRKKLNVSEALQLFASLPSDTESEDSNNTASDGENISEISEISDNDFDAEDNLHDSDEDIDPFAPGSSTQSQAVIWTKKKKIQKHIPDFSSRTGPSDEVLELTEKRPIDIFLSMFTISLMEHIVFQTNLYATQSGKSYTPITVGELCAFLGVNLLMGIKKMPSYRDYWVNEESLNDSFICKQMSSRRFSWILTNLHLNDNSLQPKKGEENFDRLYKLHPFLSHLSERFLNVFHPTENQSIDELMIKFKGRSCLKQYMPKKPIKRGYKVWMRCNDNAFASQFEIYTGKTDGEVEKNLDSKVVKKLSQCMYGKNHRIFMDNFFTSYELFCFLETQSTYGCGTVMLNRRNMPKTLLSQDKDLKRGTFDWAVSEDNIICVKWKDKRPVSILSSFPDAIDSVEIDRKEKDGRKKNKLP